MVFRFRLGKPALAAAIAGVSATAALLLCLIPFIHHNLNDTLYDPCYALRRSAADSSVVIVTANDASLQSMALGGKHWAWPWPRQFWGLAFDYVQKCGAKAAAADLLFSEPSIYNNELGDDQTFADMLDAMKMPVVLATMVGPRGSLGAFAPPAKRSPIFGAVNLQSGAVVRDYHPVIGGRPSLALQAVRSAGYTAPAWADKTFRLQYYGRHADAGGRTTFPYVAAADLFEAARDPDHPQKHGIDPALFKGKIVLFGTTAAATFDLKSSPLDKIYPGVEIHATAIENLLKYQHVKVIDGGGIALATILAAIAAASAATFPRRTSLKLLLSIIVITLFVLTVALLFRRDTIIWLPPAGPLLAMAFSVLLAFSWSYFVEDRQSRFFLKALGQYVSPQVATELKADPHKLSLSTEKRELTILFSDIAGFTDLSEELEERIGPLLNYYLGEMSQPIWAEDGLVDKYIGDAVMAFWNAPVIQADHADRACRAALQMKRRLIEIQPQLAELGAAGMSARIGINTGVCAFGNMGSPGKFNYTAIGDACNFASRLEGANKIFGTTILIGEATAELVRNRFTLRKIDVMRVKGKRRPLAVHELLGEGTPDPVTASLIQRYENAFHRYAAGEWDAAEKILLDVLADHPHDGPSRELLSRVSAFQNAPPSAGWDGVFVAKEK
jgi:adenylate cyclase